MEQARGEGGKGRAGACAERGREGKGWAARGERKRRERDWARDERRREGRRHCARISWSSVLALGVCRPIQIFASVIVQQSGQSKRVDTIIQAEQQNGRKLRSGGRREWGKIVVSVAAQILEPPAARLLEDSPAASLLEEISRVEGRRARALQRDARQRTGGGRMLHVWAQKWDCGVSFYDGGVQCYAYKRIRGW